MSSIIPVPYRVLLNKLKNLGLGEPYQGRKHPYMTRGEIVIILPNPHQGEDVDVKLTKAILKAARISRDEWLSA